jgi:rhodanese-related sulfurtransferase
MENFPEFIANHLFLFSLLIAILGLLIWNIFGNSISGIRDIAPMEATRMMNHDKAVLLDLRSEGEFADGHILNAINTPVEKLSEQTNSLVKYKNRPIILSCKHGTDSVRAVRILKQKDFNQIYCLKGGLQSWRNANLPLVRNQSNENTS